MAAQQVDSFDTLNQQILMLIGHLVESVLEPEPLFGDAYPLDFSKVAVYEYSKMTPEQLESPDLITFEWLSPTRTDRAEEFVKRMFDLNDYWLKTMETKLGLKGNVNA